MFFFTSINLTKNSAKETIGSIIWDSGASTHILRASAIRHMKNTTRRDVTVYMNHVPTRATHAVDVVICVQNNFVELKNALIVPDSNANLISIPKLQRAGFGVSFPPTRERPLTMTMNHGGMIIMQAKYSGLPTTKFSYVNIENVNSGIPLRSSENQNAKEHTQRQFWRKHRCRSVTLSQLLATIFYMCQTRKYR